MLTFHAEKADLKKRICLITRLLGEEERGARLRLGGSLRKKKKKVRWLSKLSSVTGSF